MSNNSKVGGILSVITGSIGFMGLIITVISLSAMADKTSFNSYYSGTMTYEEYVSFTHIFISLALSFGIVFSGLALAGGILALKKKLWGLALAGSIVSIFVFFPCGIPAVVFTAMGRQEFNRNPVEAAIPELST